MTTTCRQFLAAAGACDPSIADAMWLEDVRRNFTGKLVLGRRTMTA